MKKYFPFVFITIFLLIAVGIYQFFVSNNSTAELPVPEEESIFAGSPFAAQQYEAAVLGTTGLVQFFGFDSTEKGFMTNQQNSPVGTYSGSAIRGASLLQKAGLNKRDARVFNRTNQIGATQEFSINTNELTIEGWVSTYSNKSTPVLQAEVIKQGGINTIEVRYDAEKNAFFVARKDNTRVLPELRTDTIVKNTWNHIVIEFNKNGKVRVYLNGRLVDVGISEVATIQKVRFKFGAYNRQKTSVALDAFSIYKRVLTVDEIGKRYALATNKTYVDPDTLVNNPAKLFAYNDANYFWWHLKPSSWVIKNRNTSPTLFEHINKLEDLKNTFGFYPSLVNQFINIDTLSEFNTDMADAIRSRGLVPMVSYATSGEANTEEEAANRPNMLHYNYNYIMNDPTNSKAKLDNFLKGASEWGHTVLFRPEWEMNGPWYPWSVYRGNPKGYTPQSYKQNWQKLKTYSDTKGANNLKWMWCPDVFFDSNSYTFSEIYPGDQFVDYLCLDSYTPYNCSFPEYEYNNPSLQSILAVSNKPLIFGEIGIKAETSPQCSSFSTNSDKNYSQWINNTFDLLKSNSRVKGVNIFHANDFKENPANINAFKSIFSQSNWLKVAPQSSDALTQGSSSEPSLAHAVFYGYLSATNGNVNETRIITRAEAAVSISQFGGYTEGINSLQDITSNFQDVQSSDWFFPYANLLKMNGIVTGCSINPTRFCPNEQLLKVDLAVMLYRVSQNKKINIPVAKNAAHVDTFYLNQVQKDAIKYVSERNIIPDCGNSTYCPQNAVTRGDIAKALYNIDRYRYAIQ